MTDPTSLPNFPPPPDEHPLRGRVLDVLIDQGLHPDIDSDGDVAFTVQDQQLFVRCTEGDFQIMRVFGQWAISDAVPVSFPSSKALQGATLRPTRSSVAPIST